MSLSSSAEQGEYSRNDWTREEIAELFDLPFDELMWEAQGVHRRHHARGEVQLCTLLSIKTGGCAEDCGYCSQSAHADTGLKATKLMDVRAGAPVRQPRPRTPARSVSAWARHGATPRNATCPRSSR